MEFLIGIAILAGVWWLVSSFRRSYRTLDAIEDAKNRLWTRAGREAFIASPRGEWPELFDLAMDSMARNATLHDRKKIRETIQSLLPEQIQELRHIAIDQLGAACRELPEDASLTDLKRILKQRISGEFIDDYAEREGEQIENSVGLRAALIQWCVGEVTDVDISEFEPGEMTGLLAFACPQCDGSSRCLHARSAGACSNRNALLEAGIRRPAEQPVYRSSKEALQAERPTRGTRRTARRLFIGGRTARDHCGALL